MTPEQATRQLNELHARVNDAAELYRAALQRARNPWEVVREVVAPLAAYHAQVNHRQREADPAEAERLTHELLDAIRERGLLIEPADFQRPAAGIRVTDPSLARDVERTSATLRERVRERDDFARENAALLREHQDRLKMKRFRDALAGDDPDALADAMGDLPKPARQPTNVLTTDDLAVTR